MDPRGVRDEVDGLSVYKKNACIAAKELGYGETTVTSIRKAKTIGEAERIMIKARRGECI